ncbi:magnesium chelatase [Seminavis robusta]|nr:magnesium chelatase [Seminavis robusta]|eukprot:Sro2863_g338880.1 magnesium chelatase (87) ;mRNA; f:10396-10656
MLLIVLSDGKANVPLPDTSGDAWAQTEQAAAQLADLAIPTLFLDTETGMVRVGRGKELAQRLNADYLLLDDLSADGLVHTIREVVG